MILKQFLNMNKVRGNNGFLDKKIQVVKAKNDDCKRMALLNSKDLTNRADVKEGTLKIMYSKEHGAQTINNLIKGLNFKVAPQRIILNAGHELHEIKLHLVEAIELEDYPTLYRYMVI